MQEQRRYSRMWEEELEHWVIVLKDPPAAVNDTESFLIVNTVDNSALLIEDWELSNAVREQMQLHGIRVLDRRTRK
ncbi:MAG: hypothetical protein ACTHN5_12265 [Phycisphaerae bacterium]